MKRLLLSAFLFSSVCNPCFSNGGPIDGSFYYKTGQVVLQKEYRVSLVKEKLFLKLNGDMVEVRVEYSLNNFSKEDLEIPFAFPIDIYESEMGDEFPEPEKFSGDNVGLKFFLNDTEIEWETAEVPDSIDHKFSPNGQNPKILIRNWNVAVLKLASKPDRAYKLVITYTQPAAYTDWATSKSWMPNYGDRTFYYDFRPAAFWKTSSSTEIHVEVDFSKHFRMGTLNFGEGWGVWNSTSAAKLTGIYNLMHLGFSDIDPLEIRYDISIEKTTDYISKHLIPAKAVKSVKVSSQLSGEFSAANLTDHDFTTCWAEGSKGDGNGEWIEIVIDTGYTIDAVFIVPGYAKSPDLWQDNNRVKTVNYCGWRLNGNEEEKIKESSEWFLPLQWVYTDATNFSAMCGIGYDSGEGWENLNKVRITIDEVYKGNKYNDLCISEIFILGKKARVLSEE